MCVWVGVCEGPFFPMFDPGHLLPPLSGDEGRALETASDEDVERVVRTLASTKERVRVAYCTMGYDRWRTLIRQPKPDWAYHVPRPRPTTRAYFKLWELLQVHSVSLPNGNRKTLHLCEAPGGFIECTLDHFGREAVDYAATSLASGIRFCASVKKSRILHGPSDSGDDLRHPDTQDAILSAVGPGSCGLVTADGAEVDDHATIENSSLPLLAAQVHVGLRAVAPGGTMVVKTFECLEDDTLVVLSRLCDRFEEVTVCKPAYSRPTNSERYVVATRRLPDEDDSVSDTLTNSPRPDAAWIAAARSIMLKYADAQIASLKSALATRVPASFPQRGRPDRHREWI